MKTNNRLYVDVHVLQTVPPSCVNRDDTGSPKTALYGGATRARVSSQCWKKAIRDMFKNEDIFPKDELGIRTKNLVQQVAKQIQVIDPSIGVEESEKFARDTINFASKKPNKPIIPKPKDKEDDSESDKSAALFFITPIQSYSVAKLAVKWRKEDEKPSREAVTEALMKGRGIDIALFGRLVAQAPDINIDACAQVAHSISTHKVSNEYDYFTAVDDLSPEDNTGAGHIGTVEFNSSTLYRYATVDVHNLHKQLQDDTIDAVCGFIRAFVHSMPTGKQNTFANRTLPKAVLVTLRADQPVNLVGAFEKPVPASVDGYEAASAERLVAHARSVYKNFAGEPELSLVAGELLSELGAVQPIKKLLDTLAGDLRARLVNGGDVQ